MQSEMISLRNSIMKAVGRLEARIELLLSLSSNNENFLI